jgi:hypothetical protein
MVTIAGMRGRFIIGVLVLIQFLVFQRVPKD